MPAGNPAGYLPNVKKAVKRAGKNPYTVRAKRSKRPMKPVTVRPGSKPRQFGMSPAMLRNKMRARPQVGATGGVQAPDGKRRYYKSRKRA